MPSVPSWLIEGKPGGWNMKNGQSSSAREAALQWLNLLAHCLCDTRIPYCCEEIVGAKTEREREIEREEDFKCDVFFCGCVFGIDLQFALSAGRADAEKFGRRNRQQYSAIEGGVHDRILLWIIVTNSDRKRDQIHDTVSLSQLVVSQ